EARGAKPFGKCGIPPRRPDREPATRPQRPEDRLQSLWVVERIVGFANKALRTIIDIEQDRIERRGVRLNHVDDVRVADTGARIVKAIADDAGYGTARPRDDGRYKLGHHDPRFSSEHGERGAEREPHAQAADQ